MAITKEKAKKLHDEYHNAMPVKDMKSLDGLIELNATLGHEHLELFICEKLVDKASIALRNRGFVVQYLKWKANDNWRLVGISWTLPEFIK